MCILVSCTVLTTCQGLFFSLSPKPTASAVEHMFLLIPQKEGSTAEWAGKPHILSPVPTLAVPQEAHLIQRTEQSCTKKRLYLTQWSLNLSNDEPFSPYSSPSCVLQNALFGKGSPLYQEWALETWYTVRSYSKSTKLAHNEENVTDTACESKNFLFWLISQWMVQYNASF